MSASPIIQYVKQGEIDETKWNHCINQSLNGLIYAYSSYLNYMAGTWDAIILNVY